MHLSIKKKFEIYNALFLNLNYEGANSIGHLIPILGNVAYKRLKEGYNPIQIFEEFYSDYKDVIGEDKIDFMFKVIQYVERQVVLFDSIEDSISPYELEDQESILIKTLMLKADSDNEAKELLEELNRFSVRIVLTAHPTQFYRPPVLNIISKLRNQVKKNDLSSIDQLLHQLGLTSLVNSNSPTPLEEAKNIIHFCRYEYYDAIGDFVYNLSKEYPGFENENLIRIGFWPCGDRDGNPYVTHNVTKEVVDVIRMTLMKCYYQDCKALLSKLTFKNIEPRLQEMTAEIYKAMFDANYLVDYRTLLDTLLSIKEELSVKYENLFSEDLERFITKVNIFKSHFVSLDIRQDHSVHRDTINYILKSNDLIDAEYSELDNDALIDLLLHQSLTIPDLENAPLLVKDTIKNIEQFFEIQRANGEEGCHRYIISNSEDIYAVLFVKALFRWIHQLDNYPVDIIPLFETMKGMQTSKAVMQRLYSLPTLRQHLSNRKNRQTIMLGFSDGTKDGGYLKANWSIYKCKEALSQVSAEYNVTAIFFDGRGGPPARGGGKTHNFYAARSSAMANNDIQLTIQGQTITSTYGTQEKFVFNAEQMITSGLISLDNKGKSNISEEQKALIEELSETSYKYYIKLKEHPTFIPYLQNMTTLKYYGRTKVGSRPGKRNKSSQLTLSDLRAISYVGSWSQLKQNIPGYYGLGHSISAFKDQGKMGALQHLYADSPLFKTLIDNSMMSLTKCNFDLTAYMKNDEEYGDFWSILHDEYTLSKAMLLEVTQLDELMENEMRSKQSILMREEIVRPLLIIQHYALQKLNSNQSDTNHDLYEKLVVRSLYGNINASRNSA